MRHCSVCAAGVHAPGETKCWRHRVRRLPRPNRHRDPVTADVYEEVRARDGRCIGPRAGLPGDCNGPLELDHVINGGMSLRGPSTPSNLATLCSRHHRWKTENAKVGREMLTGYLASRYPQPDTGDTDVT